MTGIIFTHSIGYKQLPRVVQSEDDNMSHVNGLPVHKAEHIFPCSVIRELQITCTQRANQYQLNLKARPNTRFQCWFTEKIFYSPSYDHCNLKCYQNKEMLGKVYFGRSHPTGRTPDYLCAARRAATKIPQSNSNRGWSQPLLHAGKYRSRRKRSTPFRSLVH